MATDRSRLVSLIDTVHLRVSVDDRNVLCSFHDATAFPRLPLRQRLLVAVHGIVKHLSALHGHSGSRGSAATVLVIVLKVATVDGQWNDTVVTTGQ